MTIASRLEAAVETHPARNDLCGAIRVSRDGEVLLERAYGQASVQLGVDNHARTRFHIASVTKMFISAAVIRLAGDGRLSVREHPSAYLPALSVIDRRISLHHLLSHTSGLADVYDRPDLRIDMALLQKRGEPVLGYLTALPQLFEPGARWGYSTTGFLLLAHVLEEVCGMSFGSLVDELFLKPLGMFDTGPDDPFRVNPGRAYGHIGVEDAWRNAQNDALAEVDAPREFYSTVVDLDLWGSGLLSGRVLDSAGLASTFTAHAQVGPGSDFDPSLGYGYGWFLGPDYRWIGGMTAGFRAAMWQFPAERLNVVMLWNNESVDSHRLFETLRPILMS
jgi:CubicO group peptidase (beta-lactamase class C family)